MKKKMLNLLLSIGLAACSFLPNKNSSPPISDLENLGPAPELTNTIWLNTDQPLLLADLQGQVVLLDMWTFG